ncbi:MAG TPA: TIGR03668 family PPOX class F420-dependent oxidoreductase [Actinomycetota bacterium]|nr:TIGR03668 family PPOX class F420-dependent oxidoreductase [Actinomycetota bacterium]
MDVSEMRRRVVEARVAYLATIDSEERPHLIPVCFALDEETLYSAVDRKPKTSPRLRRLDNIRQHPTVAVLVDNYEEDWSRLWWVRLRGEARVIEEGPERDRALGLLRDKYAQYQEAPPDGAVIAVSIDEWRGWTASETMSS